MYYFSSWHLERRGIEKEEVGGQQECVDTDDGGCRRASKRDVTLE